MLCETFGLKGFRSSFVGGRFEQVWRRVGSAEGVRVVLTNACSEKGGGGGRGEETGGKGESLVPPLKNYLAQRRVTYVYNKV